MIKALVSRITFFLFLTFLLAFYYLVHKPLTPEEFETLAGLLADIVTVVAYVIFTAGIGRFIRVWLSLEIDHTLERTMIDSIFGLSVYGFVAFGLGIIGLFQPLALWGVLIVPGLIIWRNTLAWIRDMGTLLRIAFTPQTTWSRFLAIFIWIMLITAVLFAFAPPTTWDALVYHLVSLERYIDSGVISTLTDNLYLGQAQAIDIIYGVPFALFGRDTTAAPVHFWFGIAGILLCAGMVRRVTDKASGWFTIALPLTGFSFWWLLGIPYVDLGIFAYAAVITYATMRWRETQETRWLWLAGYFIGAIIGAKYTSGLIALSVGLLVMVGLPRTTYTVYVRRLVGYGIIIAALTVIFFAPWAARGYFQYDNPIYPLGSHGLEWDALRSSYLTPGDTGLISKGTAWHVFVLPLTATVLGVHNAGDYTYDAGVWFFMLPIALLFVWHALPDVARKRARDALIMMVPLWVAWGVVSLFYLVSMQPRLMSVIFPMFIIMGGIAYYGLSQLPEKPINVFFIVRFMLVASIVIVTVDVIQETVERRVLDYHLGAITRDDYILADPIAGANHHAMLGLQTLADDGVIESDARVRFFWEPRNYACPNTMTCLPDELLDHWRYPIETGRDIGDVLAEWRANNEYLLLFERGYDFLYPQEKLLADGTINGLPDFYRNVEPLAEVIWTNGPYTLYSWLENSDEN